MSQLNSPKPIFSDAAAQKAYELIVDEGNEALNLRMFITGGGCSGFQYGFTFDESINPEDYVVKKQINIRVVQENAEEDDDGGDDGDGGRDEGMKQVMMRLLIDPMSLQYLREVEVDYREDINGAQFVVKNPSAKTTCSCGSSFAI